jgi:hypothetical protein
MRIPDPEDIAHAEARLADVQSALEEVRRVLRGVEQVERTAQRGVRVLRPVGIAVGGLALVAIIVSLLRRRHGPASSSTPSSP